MKLVTAREAARDIRGLQPNAFCRRVSHKAARNRERTWRFRKDWGRTDTLTEPIKIWMSAHALAILQALSSSAQLTGRQSCSRGYWERALLIRATGDRVARRPSSTRSFQDLARPRRSCSSCGLRRSPHESAVAAGRACCRLRNGGRLPLVLHQTAVRARAEQYDARSRSGP